MEEEENIYNILLTEVNVINDHLKARQLEKDPNEIFEVLELYINEKNRIAYVFNIFIKEAKAKNIPQTSVNYKRKNTGVNTTYHEVSLSPSTSQQISRDPDSPKLTVEDIMDGDFMAILSSIQKIMRNLSGGKNKELAQAWLQKLRGEAMETISAKRSRNIYLTRLACELIEVKGYLNPPFAEAPPDGKLSSVETVFGLQKPKEKNTGVNTTYHEVSLSPSTSQQISRDPNSPKLTVEDIMDGDFMAILSSIQKIMRNLSGGKNKELAQAWLQKLCGEAMETISAKRSRNIYLTRLACELIEVKGYLNPPFAEAPPDGKLCSVETVFGLQKPKEKNTGVNTTYHEVSLSPSTSQQISRDPDSPKLTVEDIMDGDFMAILSSIQKIMRNLSGGKNKELAQAWLQKLCGEAMETISAKRSRNIYLTRLACELIEVKGYLNPPFAEAPPDGKLCSVETVFGLQKPKEKNTGVNTTHHEVSLSPSTSQQISRDPNSPKLTVEDIMDGNFMAILSSIQKIMRNLSGGKNKELAQAWLQKLCGEAMETISAKRSRNIYLTRLACELIEVKGYLNPPFAEAPPDGKLCSVETVFGLQKPKEKVLVTCQCCFTDVNEENIIRCKAQHSFCKNCIQSGVTIQVSNGIYNVPCFSCNESFNVADLKDILEKKIYEKIESELQLQEILSADISGLEQCVFCNYCYIPCENDLVFMCKNPLCMKEICRKCKSVNHLPLKCEEVEKDEEVKIRTYIEDKMTSALVRVCCSCKRKIVKESGCNKIKCLCGTTICYICNKKLDAAKGYDHFQGNHRETDKCPLFTYDSEKADAKKVRKEGRKAKREMLKEFPTVQLRIDPLAPPKKKAKKSQNKGGGET